MVAGLAFVLDTEALALTSHQGGPSVDFGAGLGLGGAPWGANVGGHLALGWWTGVYDDQFSFGKYWWLGPSVRFDGRPSRGWSLAPMLEVRRGLELIVVGVHPFLGAGPLLASSDGDGPAVGWTARAGLGVKWRRTRFWGLTARLEAGVDAVDGRPGFAGGFLLGAAFARPSRAITDPEI